MSVPVSIAADHYVGNSTTTQFIFNGLIIQQSELGVLLDDVAQLFGTQYTITGIGNATCTVVFLIAPAVDVAVTLFRTQPISQLTQYLANEAYTALKIMADMDKQIRVDQMLSEQISRAPKFNQESAYSQIDIEDPVASEYLRWKSDLTGIDSVTVSAFNISGTSATLSNPGVVFASSGTHLDTNATKLAWDNAGLTLDLMGVSRVTMEGGEYVPSIGGQDFRVLTTGSTVTPGGQPLRKATWQFFDTNINDDDNAVIKIDVLAPNNPSGPGYAKTAIHIQQFSMPDNGGDTSGILVNQTGGGNAISAFRFTQMRPVGQTNYLDNGYAIEVGSDANTAAVLVHSGLATFSPVGTVPQGILVNMGMSTSKGIVIMPAELPTQSFDGRIALEIAQYIPGGVNLLPRYALDLAGNCVHNFFEATVLTSQISMGGAGFQVARLVNDALPFPFSFYRDRLSGNLVNNDILHTIGIHGRTGGTQKALATWATSITDVTGGSEDAAHFFQAMRGGTVETFLLLDTPANGETGMSIIRNVGGSFTLQRVSMGAADSGGAGFKLLRVAN